MSIADSTCFFCGMDGLLDTGDESSIMFYGDEKNPGTAVLWDGLCAAGSRVYFGELTDQQIIESVNVSVEFMKDNPILTTDSPKERLKKVWIEDEIWRGRQEIVYRIQDTDIGS